ncbi:MAG: DNA mismatch repair endonuclease MutL [Gemmatimonadetes bacterium]|nr:DNA mismatch repair endonuclease MutL [Gemmatimonadota bacterium]
MPRIAVLASAVADQIAAGEVVERPASVAKELIENALDAGATTIDVAIEDGGRTLVSVADDGSGMDRDDALLALKRHATSKIRDAADLVGVSSFGFRGEALPAIASVSELELATATADGAGTRVRAAWGDVAHVEDVARRRGTTVVVRGLFSNAPSRLRFLKGSRSEWRALADQVTTIALTRRDVRLSLTHDGKNVLALPPASTLRARLAAIWGGAYAESFVDVDDVWGPTHVRGLVERPVDVGTRARRVHLIVNQRAVRDAGLVRAAEAAYRSTIPAGVRPSLFLELTVPGELVDVNVHPAKAEVRFRDRWPVERTVEQAVRRALGTVDAAAGLGARQWSGLSLGALATPAQDTDLLQTAAPTAGMPLFGGGEPGTAWRAAVHTGAADAAATEGTRDAHGAASHADDARGTSDAGIAPTVEVSVPPLVQLRRTWMMFEREDGVVLIDQHSAHERVLFEAFLGALESGRAPAQRLLLPLTLHLGAAEADAFEENREALEKLGYEVEGFGAHTLLVRAVPMPHPRFDAERCLRETLDALTGDREAGSAARHERLAAPIACKAAVKAGDALSQAEMRALFVSLARTTLPAHDVHGRATIVHLGWDELERRFGRR